MLTPMLSGLQVNMKDVPDTDTFPINLSTGYYGGPLVQFSRFAPRPISSSSFRLFPAFFFVFFFFFFFFFCFHFLPQLFSTFSPSFLSRPRFRGAPSIIWINYAHALYSGRRGSDVEESPYGTGESVLTRGQ